MKTIHCISGLGADQRIFQKISIPGAVLVPVHWIPFDKHDDLPCYAQKLAAQIAEENPIILGLSFGGMLASEIAKIKAVKQVFLLSSAKDATELPKAGGFVKFIAHYGLIPTGIIKIPNNEIYKRFGVTTKEEKALLMDILKHTDNSFARWAMRVIVEWQSRTHVDNIVHIHGTADVMIPPENVMPTHWIEGGGHFMAYQRADEIAALITQHLKG